MNYIMHLGYQVLNAIAPLLAIPFLSRVFHPSEIGLVASSQSLFQFLSVVAGLGVTVYGMRRIALDRNDPALAAKSFLEIGGLVFAVSVVSWILAIAAVFLFAGDISRKPVWLIASVQLLAGGTDVSWFYVGQSRFATLARRNLVVKLAFLAVVFGFIRSSDDLNVYAAAMVVSSLLGNLSVLPLLRSSIDIRAAGPASWRGCWRHLAPALPFMLPLVISQVYATLDRWTLEHVSSVADVGLYDQAQKLVRMLGIALLSIPGILLSELPGQLVSDRAGALLVFRRAFSLMAMGAVLLALMVVTNAETLSSLVFGVKFAGIAPVLQVLGLFPVLHIIGQAYGPMLHVPLGRNRVLIQSTIGAMLVNVIGMATVSARWGALGAAWVLVCAEACNGFTQMFLARDLVALRDIARDLGKALFPGAAALLVGLALKSLPIQPTLAVPVLVNLAMLVVYAGMVFLTRPLGLQFGLAYVRSRFLG